MAKIGKMEDLSREQMDELANVLLDMCLHFCGAQYTESILRGRGFGNQELASIGFDVDGEWADMDACTEA